MAKSLCNFIYAGPYHLVFFVLGMFLLLIVPCDNTALQYCPSWSPGFDLAFVPSASYSALACGHALDIFGEMQREEQPLGSPWFVGTGSGAHLPRAL